MASIIIMLGVALTETQKEWSERYGKFLNAVLQRAGEFDLARY